MNYLNISLVSLAICATGCGLRTQYSEFKYEQKEDKSFSVPSKTISVNLIKKSTSFNELYSYSIPNGFIVASSSAASLKVNISINQPSIQGIGTYSAPAYSSGTNQIGTNYWKDYNYNTYGLIQVQNHLGEEIINYPFNIDVKINYGFRVINNQPMSGSSFLKEFGSEKAYYSIEELNLAIKNNWDGLIKKTEQNAIRQLKSIIDASYKEKFQSTIKSTYLRHFIIDNSPTLEIPRNPFSKESTDQVRLALSNYKKVAMNNFKDSENKPFDEETTNSIKFNLAFLYFANNELKNSSNELNGITSNNELIIRCKQELLHALTLAGNQE